MKTARNGGYSYLWKSGICNESVHFVADVSGCHFKPPVDEPESWQFASRIAQLHTAGSRCAELLQLPFSP